jgi:hypothetical protein
MIGDPELRIRRLFGSRVTVEAGRRRIEILTLLHADTPRPELELVGVAQYVGRHDVT